MTSAGRPGPARPAPDVLPDGVDAAFARSVRFWLRAYPRRWRTARGEEVLGLLADLAAPGTRRLDARSAVDLVRGGWATRGREHPPLGSWLAYRFFDRRLPAHLPWVRDDLDGPFYPARMAGSAVALIIVLTVALDSLVEPSAGPDPASIGLMVGVWACAAVLAKASWRRRARERHLVPRPGEPVRLGHLVRVFAPRRRVAARAGLPWLAAGLTVLTGACITAAATARTTLRLEALPAAQGVGVNVELDGAVPRVAILVALALALGVGLVRAARARRRLRAPDLPAQPHRLIVGMDGRAVVGGFLAVAAAAALPVLEVLGEVPLALSLPIGLVAGALAPPVVAAWAAVARAPSLAPLAVTDVWRVALTGRPPLVDGPGVDLVPADPALVGMVEHWPWSNEGPRAALG